MNKSVMGIGDRNISGDIKNIYYLGDIVIDSCKFNYGKMIGDITFNNCNGNKLSAIGDLNFTNCNFSILKLLGDITFNSICKVGYLSFYGNISADILDCKTLVLKAKSKMFKFNGSNHTVSTINIISKISGVTFISNSDVKIIGDMSFVNIINNGSFCSDNDIECEKFYSTGLISSTFINSDISYIYPRKKSKINLLAGTRINVTRKFPKESKFSIPPNIEENEIISIDEIEGDIINVECVTAKSISGIDVKIGDLCIVDTVYYKENLTISPKAIVTNIIKL